MARVEVGLEDLARGVDQLRQRPGVVKQAPVGIHPLGADLLQRRHQQVGDGAEVVEHQRLVAARPLGDPPRAGTGEPRLPQRVNRRRHQRGPCLTHPALPSGASRTLQPAY